MEVYFIVGHRHEQYDGQNGPEILEVVDEWTMYENPDWIRDKYAQYEDTKEFAALKIVETSVSAKVLMDILYKPDTVELGGIKEVEV